MQSPPLKNIKDNTPPSFVDTISSLSSTMTTEYDTFTSSISDSISSPSSLEPTIIIEASTRPPTPHPIHILTPPSDDDLPPIFLASTPSDDLHPGVTSVDVPIFAHHLQELPEQIDLDLMLDHLKDSHLASTLDAHMDIGSPLYSLYKIFMQITHLNNLYSTNSSIAQIALWATITRDVKEHLEGKVLLALQQLGMLEFIADVERYLWQIAPTIVQEPSIPSTTSFPLNPEERDLIEMMEINWRGHDENIPLTPSHPWYHEACFACRRLGHRCVNCHYNQCPRCLEWFPNHTQGHCPQNHKNQNCRPSASLSGSSHQPLSPSPLPTWPRPLIERMSNRAIRQHSTRIHCSAPCRCITPITRDDNDDLDLVWDETAYTNTSGSPGPEYGGYNWRSLLEFRL